MSWPWTSISVVYIPSAAAVAEIDRSRYHGLSLALASAHPAKSAYERIKSLCDAGKGAVYAVAMAISSPKNLANGNGRLFRSGTPWNHADSREAVCQYWTYGDMEKFKSTHMNTTSAE